MQLLRFSVSYEFHSPEERLMGRRILLAILALFATAAVAAAQTGADCRSGDGDRGAPAAGHQVTVCGTTGARCRTPRGVSRSPTFPGQPHRSGPRHRLRLVDRRRLRWSPARRRHVELSLTPRRRPELKPIVVTGYGEQERRTSRAPSASVTGGAAQGHSDERSDEGAAGPTWPASRSSRRATSLARR